MFNILKKREKMKTDQKETLYQAQQPAIGQALPQEDQNKNTERKSSNPSPILSPKPEPEKPEIENPSVDVFNKKIELIDAIAPKIIETDFDFIKINDTFFRTIFVSGYPRFVSPGWLEPIINFNASLDLSFYIYPIEGKSVLDDLRRKITEMEAEIATDIERGKVIDPNTQAKLEDALTLQEQLVKGAERFFEFAFYITIPAATIEELDHITKQVESTLGSLMIIAKKATLDMENGFLTTVPFGFDRLAITRNMDSTSLATTFPLTSAELSSDEGVLYGINSQNGSFIIFDRFSLENSNMTIFATSGAGKSYFVKLESLRSLMLGTEVIILDPEAEYKPLCEAVGGEYISFSFNSPSKINPFDLSQIYTEGENQLGLKILTLHSFFKVIMGKLDPIKEALLDRAIVATYQAKGITQDPSTQKKEPPLMEDLYKTLIGMETQDALDLASRIERFVKGSFVGIFDRQTNIDINNPFTVFSVKDMQEALRPIAMFMILDFIWTRVQRNIKKRLLIVDEAWHMMRYEDSAQFLWSVVKRARKYFLGLTTITQDVEDFLSQDIGKAIVTNSALRVLLKQSPTAIDRVGEVFYLSQGEKQLLLSASVGEGIFFAGPHHAPIRVVASPEEHQLITSNPIELTNRNNATPNQAQQEQSKISIKTDIIQ
jgi:conjugal transfer ATP-binding protein TraC